jgi:hypothetical protein
MVIVNRLTYFNMCALKPEDENFAIHTLQDITKRKPAKLHFLRPKSPFAIQDWINQTIFRELFFALP